jgi:hypothetical protein
MVVISARSCGGRTYEVEPHTLSFGAFDFRSSICLHYTLFLTLGFFPKRRYAHHTPFRVGWVRDILRCDDQMRVSVSLRHFIAFKSNACLTSHLMICCARCELGKV